MNIFSSHNDDTKIDPKAEAKLRELIAELEVETEVFENKARIRNGRLEHQLEVGNHEANVTEFEIKHDIEEGLKKINDAAKKINLKDDKE